MRSPRRAGRIRHNKIGRLVFNLDGGVAIVCDTSVLRPEGTDFANNPDTVLTEIVALSLHSVEPIRVTYNGGMTESFFDVFVTLDGAAPPGANRGQYLVSRHSADGGMILEGVDSFFDVFFELQFTNQETGGVHVLQREDHVELTASVPWSHVAPPSYYHPGSGDFFPGVRGEEPPESLIFQGSELKWEVRLRPIPEPCTVALLCGGLLPLLRRRKRRGVTREA